MDDRVIATPFLTVLGIGELPVYAGGKAVLSVETSLLLDVTGSMSGQKIADLKLAAKDLIDIVIWEDQSKYTSKIALVPFLEAVNVGLMAAQAASNASPTTRVSGDGDKGKGDQRGAYQLAADCVSERTGAEAFTDAAPNGQYKVGRVYTSDGTCSPPNEVVPLYDDKAMLKNVIDSLVASGSTAGHLGTAWAWYSISPHWGNVFGPKSRPEAYGTPKLHKIAVLMTDGEYNTEYDRGVKTSTTGGQSPNGTSTEQARQLCASMKAAGITVAKACHSEGRQCRSGSDRKTCKRRPWVAASRAPEGLSARRERLHGGGLRPINGRVPRPWPAGHGARRVRAAGAKIRGDVAVRRLDSPAAAVRPGEGAPPRRPGAPVPCRP